MTTEAEITYAWSRDEEEYHGRFDTRQAAIDEALEECKDSHFYKAGDPIVIFTGRCVDPEEVIAKIGGIHLANHVVEYIEDYVAEEIPSDTSVIELQGEHLTGLGKLILDYVAEHHTSHRYGITRVEKFEGTMP